MKLSKLVKLYREARRENRSLRVEAGKPGTEDHDTGTVIDVNETSAPGHEAYVAWDSLAKTWCDADSLREER